MESEKVKEIKKALEYAIQVGLDKFSLGASLSDCLTLINELESENERYKQSCEAIGQNSLTIINQLKDRIAELEKENKILQGTKERLTFADRKKLVDNAVEIKLKQFAEKLKEEIPDESTFGYLGYNGVMEVIDETLKEFLGK